MRKVAIVLAVGLFLLLPAAPVAAQIPDEFKNLKVLPKDIGKQELVSIMRGWAGAIGQRCNYCHVGPDNLQGMDFATDELEHKRVARGMAQMVTEINTKLLPASGKDGQVRCVTCHHGLTEPGTIDTIVLETIRGGGVEAGVARYRELREEHYGRGRYDFGSPPLNDIAETVARQMSDVDGAIAIMKLSLEYNDAEAMPHIVIAQLYATKGEHAAAVTELERAVAIEPDNRWAQQQLEKVKQAQAGGE